MPVTECALLPPEQAPKFAGAPAATRLQRTCAMPDAAGSVGAERPRSGSCPGRRSCRPARRRSASAWCCRSKTLTAVVVADRPAASKAVAVTAGSAVGDRPGVEAAGERRGGVGRDQGAAHAELDAVDGDVVGRGGLERERAGDRRRPPGLVKRRPSGSWRRGSTAVDGRRCAASRRCRSRGWSRRRRQSSGRRRSRTRRVR